MVPDYEPTIPEWFHQQYELERFLVESRERLVAEEKTARKRRWRYFVGTAVCWSAAFLVFALITRMLPVADHDVPLVTEPPQPFVRSASAVPERTAMVRIVEAQRFASPLLPESAQMKVLLDQLGAVEIEGSLYTSWGASYQGSLWVRKVTRGENVYLDEALHYQINGPFRLRLPANSTIYIYAQVPGLAWNGGWGVPIQTPPSAHCKQPDACALRLEELMYIATGR
jgi:hypothetical protein